MTARRRQPDQDDCPFCRIVTRDPWSQIFYADADVVAFLDIAPATKGHTLVVPRLHSVDIFDAGDDQFATTARGVKRVAEHILTRLHPEGLTLMQSNRAAGWQDVFHLHFHLIPRYPGDGLVLPWTPGHASAAEIRTLTDALR